MNKKCSFLSFETSHNIDVKNTHTKYENLGPEDKIVLPWSCMIEHSLFDLVVKVQDHSHFVLVTLRHVLIHVHTQFEGTSS